MSEEHNELQCKEDREQEMENRRWKNRRYMAWLSFLSILVVTYLAFFVIDITKLDKLDDIITWFYTIMGTVVGAYMGLSTYAEIKKK